MSSESQAVRETTKEPHGPVVPGRRIAALDTLRGFALCGIIFINIPQTMAMLESHSAPDGVQLFVLGRFYPIFYLLFGIGFGIFLRSAQRRGDNARLLLLRRFLALAVIGALHHLLQPGEVLLPFAIVGLIVLLPLSYLSGRVNLWIGIALTVVGIALGVGGLGILPGIFVLGFALAELGVPASLDERVKQLAHVLVVGAGAAAAVIVVSEQGTSEELGRRLGLIASCGVGAAYASGFVLLLRTPLGVGLSRVLAPLGRMALTNYLSATVLFVIGGNAIGLRESGDWGSVGVLGAAILVLQAIWSPVWLRAFRYGPAEWLWRCVTYWRAVPIRERASAPAAPARAGELQSG